MQVSMVCFMKGASKFIALPSFADISPVTRNFQILVFRIKSIVYRDSPSVSLKTDTVAFSTRSWFHTPFPERSVNCPVYGRKIKFNKISELHKLTIKGRKIKIFRMLKTSMMIYRNLKLCVIFCGSWNSESNENGTFEAAQVNEFFCSCFQETTVLRLQVRKILYWFHPPMSITNNN